MGRSGPLSETQLRAAIRDLASADESKRCGAACRLCGAAIDANTDIRAAIPALAACAAEPHSTNLVAMWAQQALAACARRGGDIRPAKAALLAKLRDSVNHYAADALRAWASRSVAAAAEILEDVKRTIPGDRSLPGKGLTGDLEILAKRLIPDAERTWAADRRRGVRVYAGRLLWLTSHGWDQAQGLADYVRNGPPKTSLAYWTGGWEVPLDVQNDVRGWLGMPAIEETEGERERRRVEGLLERLFAETFATPPGDCRVCGTIGAGKSASPLAGERLPAEVAGLRPALRVTSPGLAGESFLRRCPSCGDFFTWDYTRDCEPFEPETDLEQVTRITADKARELVLEKAFQRGETVYWPEDRKR